MTKTSSAQYDCNTCGACCVGQVVMLNEEEAKKGRFRNKSEVQEYGLTFLKGMTLTGENNKCPFFKGTVGQKCTCTIYKKRPDMCKVFGVGSEQCKNIRKSVGLKI